MHRRNYILIAKVLREAKTKNSDIGMIISAFCLELKTENPSFNEQKFIDYIKKGK